MFTFPAHQFGFIVQCCKYNVNFVKTKTDHVLCGTWIEYHHLYRKKEDDQLIVDLVHQSCVNNKKLDD